MPDLRLLRSGRGGIVFYVLNGHGDSFIERISCDAAVVSVRVDDWNREMSPWKAEKCFKDGDDFGGGAGEFLAALVRKIPEFEKQHGLEPAHRALCGYSLAGLCALYGLYVSDMFDGAAGVSGSVWFDGWMEFMETHAPMNGNVRAYISVGDREARTRNMRLSRVEECSRKAREILENNGHEAEFELNPGNHFNDPDGRVARGIDRLFEMYTKN